MSIEFSTANVLIELKEKRNLCLIELLKIEEIILYKEIKMRSIIINFNKSKIEKIMEINDIENKQKLNYDLIRESKIEMLTNEINDSSYDLDEIKKEIHDYKLKCEQLIKHINYLNSQIPDKTIVTNVKIKIADTSQTCHKAMQGL
jgi:hypothetical protein